MISDALDAYLAGFERVFGAAVGARPPVAKAHAAKSSVAKALRPVG
jgi:hypothetical protein